MDEAISIGGNGTKIIFSVLGYENPGAQNINDANWLGASLLITAGPFTGSINLSITTHELISLHSQITKAVKSLHDNIDFETMESNWTFCVAFETTGAVVINGNITANPISGNVLRYEFRTDPITLESFAEKLQHLIRKFPVQQPI